MRQYGLLVEHCVDRLVGDGDCLVHLVRGAESIEKVEERNARLQRGDVRHQGQVGSLLHGARRQHGVSRGAAGHHVRVVAEDGQRMGRHRARGHMNDVAGQLPSDLVHVGDHQQQSLRRGKCSAEGARLQCAMHGASGPALALHLGDQWHGAPDVLASRCLPLIGPLRHGGRRGDRVDGDHLRKPVRHPCTGLISVQNRRLLFTHSVASKVHYRT